MSDEAQTNEQTVEQGQPQVKTTTASATDLEPGTDPVDDESAVEAGEVQADTDTSAEVAPSGIVGRLREELALIEDEVGYEAQMAKTKLTEAIHWLTQHFA